MICRNCLGTQALALAVKDSRRVFLELDVLQFYLFIYLFFPGKMFIVPSGGEIKEKGVLHHGINKRKEGKKTVFGVVCHDDG